MFRKQFLLTSKDISSFDGFDTIKIGTYYLHHHIDLRVSTVKTKDIEVYLLGSLYSWEHPALKDSEILNSISGSNLNDFLVEISQFYGEYVIIYKDQKEFVLFNDACAQNEIYYDKNFEAFGTQPKIINAAIPHEPHSNIDAINYYESNHFKKKRLFVGDTTHVNNVKHLLANHYINVYAKTVKRFFPVLKKEELPLDVVAKKASKIIKGYLEAISQRHDIILPVTGGYDSRILFLASQEVTGTCKYFVSKHSHMDAKHNDITIPKKLTALYNKEFLVIEEIDTPQQAFKKEYIDSIDFPRYITISSLAKPDNVLLNANISEVSSCLLGYHKKITPVDLAVLKDHSPALFPINQYKNWLKRITNQTALLNYNILDLFYWEEFESNWVAKLKTEGNAIDVTVMSPFNSRYLLNLMLSVKRSQRGVFNNRLYDRIIFYLSNNNKVVLNLPINPDLKTKIYRLMSKLGVLNTYQTYKLKKKSKFFLEKLK